MDSGADVTARDEVGDRVRGLDAGADDYLVKPFSLLELAPGCGRWRGGTTGPPAVLAEGDLKLDPAPSGPGAAAPRSQLSPKEFSLLELFLRHPARC